MIGWITAVYLKLRALLRRNHDADLREELRLHLESLEEECLAAGMSAEEARAAARRQFGNVTRITEQSRDLFSFRWIDELLRDVRVGLRSLRRSKGFALVAVSAMAVGVGANVTVFGFVNGLLLRPLSVSEPDRLIRAYSPGSDPRAFVGYADYLQYRDRSKTLAHLAMSNWGGLSETRTEGRPPQMIHVMPVTGNYFETIGVRAAMGRTIGPEDDQSEKPDVAVLSDACWRRYYNADPTVVGRTIFLNRVPYTIVGVLPHSFRGTDGSTLTPMHYIPWKQLSDSGHLIGRLKPGTSLDDAQADLSRIATQLSVENNRPASIVIYPARTTSPLLAGQFTLTAALFMLVVAMVLLIACDNIAILLMARWAGRRREIGMRLALGASRLQLIRQLLTENVALSVVGGICGFAAATWIGRLLERFSFPVPMPHALPFALDWRVTAFAVGITLSTTLLFGLSPALQSTKSDVLTSLKEGGLTDGPKSIRTRAVLAATQIAMCTTLLVTTAVLIRSLQSTALTAGFSARGITMATVNLSSAGYTPEASVAFYQSALNSFEKTAGVVSASIVENVPLMPNAPLTPLEARAESGAVSTIYTNAVSRGHFRTLGIPLVEGRDFTERDDLEDRPVGIVNETLARRMWPGRSAIGRTVHLPDGSTLEVVGVAGDVKYESLDEGPKAFLYRPLEQQPAPAVTFLVKTTVDPPVSAAALQALLIKLDPNLLVYNLTTLDERMRLNLLPNQAAALLGGVLGLLALSLSTIGTYGAMAFLARQRTREIGIRIALGAPSSNVVRLVTSEGIVFTAAGLLLGLSGAVASVALLRRFLYGISLFDPAAFISVTALLAVTAYLACYIPARRASRIDPAIVLHDR